MIIDTLFMAETHTRSFYFQWILSGKVAIGIAPKNKDEMEYLIKKGIKNILNLCNEYEYKPPLEFLSEFNYKIISLPDHKTKKLPKIEDIISAVKYLEDINQNGPTFIHCMAAIERSPLICMAYLMRVKKLTLNQSLNYLMQVNKRTNPLPSQYEILKEFN